MKNILLVQFLFLIYCTNIYAETCTKKLSIKSSPTELIEVIQCLQKEQISLRENISTRINLIPVGAVVAFTGNTKTIPNGWFLCDGRKVKREEYRKLFKTIGTIHGSGDGVTSFNLPDYRGRFLRGTDLGANRDPNRNARTSANSGGNIGDSVGTLQSDSFLSHTHKQRTTRTNTTSQSGAFKYQGAASNATFENMSGMLEDTGGDETRPKNVNVNWIIKF